MVMESVVLLLFVYNSISLKDILSVHGSPMHSQYDSPNHGD